MISTVADFEDATAFERYVLADGVGLAIPDQGTASLDLRSATKHIAIGINEVMGGGAAAEVRQQLRPLLFGAAWKVLDLLVELAINRVPLPPDRGNDWTIARKVQHARAALGDCPPLTDDRDLWTAMAATYVATEELRHSLVHRTVSQDPGTHALHGVDRAGQPLPPVSDLQQIAFVAHRNSLRPP